MPFSEAGTFQDQLESYALGTMKSGETFLVGESCHDLGLSEVEDLPLTMKQKTLKKVVIEHDLNLAQLMSLTDWLKEHPLALDSLTEPHSIVVVTEAHDAEDRPVIVAIRLDKEFERFCVNEIASVYGKENLAYLIENTMNAGLEVYTNARTQEWLSRTRLPLPQPTAILLDDIIRGDEPEIKAHQEARAEVLAWSPHQGEPKPDWVVSFRDDVWNPEEGRTFGVTVDSGQELFVHPGEVLVREPFGWYEVKTAEYFEEQRRMFASSLDASCEVPARQQPPRQTPSSAERSARDQAAATKAASTQAKDRDKALKPWERTNHF